jgi:hypothetical protein
LERMSGVTLASRASCDWAPYLMGASIDKLYMLVKPSLANTSIFSRPL